MASMSQFINLSEIAKLVTPTKVEHAKAEQVLTAWREKLNRILPERRFVTDGHVKSPRSESFCAIWEEISTAHMNFNSISLNFTRWVDAIVAVVALNCLLGGEGE